MKLMKPLLMTGGFVILLVFSFMVPFLVYVVIALAGFIAVYNNYLIEGMIQSEPDQPKDTKTSELDKLIAKGFRNIAEGFTLDEIEDALTEKYDAPVPRLVMKNLRGEQ